MVTKDIDAYSIVARHEAKVVRSGFKYPKTEVPNLK